MTLTRLKLAALSGVTCGLVVLLGLLAASGDATVAGSRSASVVSTVSQIATTTYQHDLKVTAWAGSTPQVILTTPAADYTGEPVVATFSAQYANMIPQPGTTSNGIAFDLYMDGQLVEQMGLFGNHNTTDNLFTPINLTDVLDGARTPSAGQHTFSVGVRKWQAGADGYIRGDGGMAIRLSVSRL